MGKHHKPRSKTLPSSPTHSSSSSDFEFTIALSPRKSSASLCPADELFYKGQLLPLHLSPRISMVRTLLLSSSSTSSSATTTTTARDSSSSTDSSTSSSSSFASDLALLASGIDNNTQPPSWSASDFNNSRPSSTVDADLTKKLLVNTKPPKSYFSRFSNVFKKDNPNPKPADRDPNDVQSGSRPARKPTSSAKDIIRKYYLKTVKPLYEKLSHTATKSPPLQQQQQQQSSNRSAMATVLEACDGNSNLSQSFSGNLGCPRRTRRSCVASCPSSMRSSPSHSGVLSRARATTSFQSDSSTMEELQSAIQGAIAHCKNSMVQSNKAGISNEI